MKLTAATAALMAADRVVATKNNAAGAADEVFASLHDHGRKQGDAAAISIKSNPLFFKNKKKCLIRYVIHFT